MDKIILSDGQELDVTDTTTRQLLIVATNVLAKVARKTEGCSMPEGVVKMHTDLLEETKDGLHKLTEAVNKIDKKVEVMSAEVTRGNTDMSELFKQAEDSRNKIVTVEKEMLKMTTAKSTTKENLGMIGLIITTLVGWAFLIWERFKG